MFFLIYRPSCFIEAYCRPEMYWLCVLGYWLPIYSISTPFSLATDRRRRRNERI
jgi:hypothetical protein